MFSERWFDCESVIITNAQVLILLLMMVSFVLLAVQLLGHSSYCLSSCVLVSFVLLVVQLLGHSCYSWCSCLLAYFALLVVQLLGHSCYCWCSCVLVYFVLLVVRLIGHSCYCWCSGVCSRCAVLSKSQLHISSNFEFLSTRKCPISASPLVTNSAFVSCL